MTTPTRKINYLPSRPQLCAWGKKGGSATTAKKAVSAQRNGAMPCRNGKRRGWPKGKPRKKVLPASGE